MTSRGAGKRIGRAHTITLESGGATPVKADSVQIEASHTGLEISATRLRMDERRRSGIHTRRLKCWSLVVTSMDKR